MSAGQFRGTSIEQDSRFSNKEQKLLKSLSKEFPPEFSKKVDLTRVNWDSLKPWIEKRVSELLGGLEDEILLNFIFESVVGRKNIDPRKLQISLMGFLEKDSGTFCKELWTLLQDAAANENGIPSAFIAAAKAEREARYPDIHRDREREYRSGEEMSRNTRWERRGRYRDQGHSHGYNQKEFERDRYSSPVRSQESREWSYRSPEDYKDRRRRRRSPSVEAKYLARCNVEGDIKTEHGIKTEDS